jgi:TonB-linked SusC/RagA family outer membrane protein
MSMMRKLLLTALFSAFLLNLAMAQDRVVSGKVTSADDGTTLPGVSVLVQGTTKGTATDANGAYSISLASGENTLVFSFIGYKTQTVAVSAQSTVDIILETDITALEEVVVVGYGVQKEKDLTSAISTIKSDELIKTPQGQAMQALQGKVTGVQIVNTGTPGSSPTVRIRGIGSYPGIGNTNPLYVVDGMFFDNIDFLNPSDISTLSVLKDASAAAIYGVRAANGVVLITTKSGGYNKKTEITYDGYLGTQVAQNVLKMANAEQFTNMALESGSASDIAYVNAAMQRYGRSRINPNVPDVNTDWYKEILRPATIQNHSIAISGGDKNTSYSVGTSYFKQGGILDMKNSYERFNVRLKLDHAANDWLTVGGNALLSNGMTYGQSASAWNVAYFAVPIMPVIDEQNTDAFPTRYASAQTLGYRDGKNPFPFMDFSNNQIRTKKILTNFYAKFNFLEDKLSFQTTYNVGGTFQSERYVGLPFYVSAALQRNLSSITKTSYNTYNQIWDNVLNYRDSFGNHNIEGMLGMSYRDESWETLSGSGNELQSIDEENAWFLSQTPVESRTVSDGGNRIYGLSYFGRFAYNYNEKYLFYATLRRDGTMQYQEKWGTFPALGAGWVLSEENFMSGLPVNYLKLRAGWGRLGNSSVPSSSGANTASVVTTGINGTIQSGTVSTNNFSYLLWEKVEGSNIGIDLEVLSNRLRLTADYYLRDTKDAAIPIITPITGQVVSRSVGVIRNSGIEVALNWSDEIAGGLRYNVGVNFTTVKNETRDIYGQPYIDGGQAEFRQRTIVGQPLAAFFGYEVLGVYQTAEQVAADPAAVAQGGLVPGDFIYKDQNGDNVIDEKDRVVLGSYLPKVTYGANLGLSYKNFDLGVNVYGQAGNKILNRKRGEVIWTNDGNMDADLAVNRWHGEGTSNKYPSSSGLRRAWNQKMSNYFVEDGGFFRIQNINLSYKLNNKNVGGVKLPEMRFTLTAERPLTTFNYNGFNPEIADGIDTQTYPIPAVYTAGVSVKF